MGTDKKYWCEECSKDITAYEVIYVGADTCHQYDTWDTGRTGPFPLHKIILKGKVKDMATDEIQNVFANYAKHSIGEIVAAGEEALEHVKSWQEDCIDIEAINTKLNECIIRFKSIAKNYSIPQNKIDFCLKAITDTE